MTALSVHTVLPAGTVLSSPRPQGPCRSESRAFAAALTRSTGDAEPNVVRTTRTALSGAEAADALARAWTEVTGEAPGERTVAVLTAQWAHETGRGAQMMNFNFGGIKGSGPSGLTAEYGTREGWGATERHTVARFRAYRTADEGAVDYVRLLTQRYPEAARAARDGNPERFVHALKERRYFTGNEDAYVRSVQGLTARGLESGFDAMGGAARGVAPARLDLPAIARRADVSAPEAFDSLDAAQAVADELGRVALQALVGRARGDEFNPADPVTTDEQGDHT